MRGSICVLIVFLSIIVRAHVVLHVYTAVGHAMQCVGVLMAPTLPSAMTVAIVSFCESIVRLIENGDMAASVFGVPVTRELKAMCVSACAAMVRGAPALILAVFAAHHSVLSKSWPGKKFSFASTSACSFLFLLLMRFQIVLW